MKILVIGGMHGNEPLGVKVVKEFNKNPAKNIDAELANMEAIAADCRFVEQDLNRSFPGDENGVNYEQRRAYEIIKLSKNYDLVLDFHNTRCDDNDCSFVGESADATLFDVSSWFGLNRVIVADYDCLNKYAPNCISIEISMASQLNDPDLWVGLIKRFARQKSIPKAQNIEKYRFAYRLSLEDRDKYKLPDRKLKVFEPIDEELAGNLNLATPAFPIFLGDNFTPYNYGGVLNRIS